MSGAFSRARGWRSSGPGHGPFEFVIKTAKAVGVEVAARWLALADEGIE